MSMTHDATEPLATAALWIPSQEPWYVPQSDEVQLFEQCYRQHLAVLLKGPTGCGKTRFVEYMAWKLQRPLITIACHDDLSASDLVGRFLLKDNETVWQDGPLARAVRSGAICYLDEVVEARQDTVVVIHALTDHRRLLPMEKTGELLTAAPGFHLVVSYNPGYQHISKDLKPSTRQRFVSLDFNFPQPEQEIAIVAHEAGINMELARVLVSLGGQLRRLRDKGLDEVPSTRLLVAAGRLIGAGIPEKRACQTALISPLSDDALLVKAMSDLVEASFG